MGISIVRFEDPGQGGQWGVVEQEAVAVLNNTYPSHREQHRTPTSSPRQRNNIGHPPLHLVSGFQHMLRVFRTLSITSVALFGGEY